MDITRLSLGNKLDGGVSPAIISTPLQLIYIPIAKVASTSIKMLLWDFERIANTYHEWDIHKAPFLNVTPYDTLYQRLANGKNPELNYKVVACIRHPLERLWSCYKDKFSHPKRFKDLEFHKDRLNLSMTFTEFVQALKKIDLDMANEHLRRQSAIIEPYYLRDCLNNNKPMVNVHIMKFSNLDEQWSELMKFVPNQDKSIHLKHYNKKKETKENWKDNYTYFTSGIARDLYQQDLEMYEQI